MTSIGDGSKLRGYFSLEEVEDEVHSNRKMDCGTGCNGYITGALFEVGDPEGGRDPLSYMRRKCSLYPVRGGEHSDPDICSCLQESGGDQFSGRVPGGLGGQPGVSDNGCTGKCAV